MDDLEKEWVWTAPEVARVLKVKASTVRNLHRVGKLPGIMIGRHLRWLPEDVKRYLEGMQRSDLRSLSDD